MSSRQKALCLLAWTVERLLVWKPWGFADWQVEVIGVDEAQFMKDLLHFSTKAADMEGKTMIIAGLDGDFRRYT